MKIKKKTRKQMKAKNIHNRKNNTRRQKKKINKSMNKMKKIDTRNRNKK